ncbi:thioredoxin-like protein [Kockovaella imperatae]|uniref:thioredoxin-dependent peroxiredoxin n=1 Tax=Kockovaella imperatae TaxID=4999 RepID=A0A1Y1US22_9TREE|nr:thioredoxin-like protein [Kockovaella imperatae]ORX40818.1 thioredoxin-like protein [Kockovaella imperatae]
MSSSLIGKPAPIISLPNIRGGQYELPLGHKPIALFFFPKAGTSGCTTEVCSFRDAQKENVTFQRYPDLEIVGVSADPVAKGLSFADQHNLPFPLLSDEKGSARKAYGVEKSLFGLADGRETFFIDRRGIVKGTHRGLVNAKAHVQFIEQMLKEAGEETQ